MAGIRNDLLRRRTRMNVFDDLPAALAGGPFRLDTASVEGVTRRELRSSRFVHLVRDVYIARELAGDPWARYAAVRLLVPSAVMSHDTAARLWRLPVPDVARGAVRPVHLTVPPGHLPSRGAGMVAHECQLDAADVAIVGRPAQPGRPAMRLPVTTPLRCFLDVCGSWSLADVVAYGDAALAGQRFEARALRDRVAAAGRRRGVVTAREAVTMLDPRAAGPAHSRLRAVLVSAGLPRPRAGLDLYDAAGRWLTCADLAWPDLRVLLMLDPAAPVPAERRAAEQRRRGRMAAAGWDVVVVHEPDVALRPWDVLVRVWRTLAERGWGAPSSTPPPRAGMAALARPGRTRYVPPPPRPPRPSDPSRRSVA